MKKISFIFSVFFMAAACSDAILDIEQDKPQKITLEQNARLIPANPQISPEAQQVLDYLQEVADNNNILAGQQLKATRTSLYTSDSEYQHIYDVVGRYPAVLGLDWYVQDQTIADANSMRERKVEMAIEHWNQGGIVTFSWHQQYPGHLDEPYAWVKRQTTQSEFDDIISQGTPLYNLWQADVDQIAGYMQDLENAGVPVIFRPYHEMQGSWFWWGGKSPASYIQLWNNLYDRLVNYHGLDNLLWCWSPNKYVVNSYFPGNDKVDLTGVDIYSTNRADSRYISDYSILQGLTSKPSVLAENGLLPEVSVLDQTNYAWFLPWHSTWCDNIFYGLPPSNGPGNSPTELLDVYNHPKVITLDEVSLDGSMPEVGNIKHIENKARAKYLQNLTTPDGSGSDICGAPGSNVRGVNTSKSGDATKWELVAAQGEYFYLKNVARNTYLQLTYDVSPDPSGSESCGSTYAIRGVPAGACDGDWTQWKQVDAGNGYVRLENKGNGYWLQMPEITDIDDGSLDGGLQVRAVSNCKTGDATRWKFVATNNT